MRIVKGRGRNRIVYNLPSGGIVKNADAKEQKDYLRIVCELLSVKFA
jgi:hypothetical protein